ncbi:SseB family protein [Rhodobacteraceae bacterium XHP0102]|nr:SseB family protein [Rhodobacteraceae bacterium XHP0102]
MTASSDSIALTPLDQASVQMQAAEHAEAARLRFYDRLLSAELFVLLNTPAQAQDGKIDPKILSSEGTDFVLAFDTEERLSQFVEGTEAPYAALTGRALAGMLAPLNIGLGLNLGVAPSETLLDGAAMVWLHEIGVGAPTALDARPVSVMAPRALPQDLLLALDGKLAGLEGLASSAYLALVDYQDGSRNHILCFVDAAPEAHDALARAVSQSLHLSGVEAAVLDVAFLPASDPFVAKLAKHGLRFDLPQPQKPQVRPAPGTDPDNPPKLR